MLLEMYRRACTHPRRKKSTQPPQHARAPGRRRSASSPSSRWPRGSPAPPPAEPSGASPRVEPRGTRPRRHPHRPGFARRRLGAAAGQEGQEEKGGRRRARVSPGRSRERRGGGEGKPPRVLPRSVYNSDALVHMPAGRLCISRRICHHESTIHPSRETVDDCTRRA